MTKTKTRPKIWKRFISISSFFTISKFPDSQMFNTISPYSDHNVYLSRPARLSEIGGNMVFQISLNSPPKWNYKWWKFKNKYCGYRVISKAWYNHNWGPIKNFCEVQKMPYQPSKQLDQVLSWAIFCTLLAGRSNWPPFTLQQQSSAMMGRGTD